MRNLQVVGNEERTKTKVQRTIFILDGTDHLQTALSLLSDSISALDNLT